MMLNFVYVLIADESDYNIEQLLLSVFSLKKFHPNDKVSLVTDILTKNLIYDLNSPLIKFIDDLKVVSVPIGFSKIQRSRFLKTRIREIIVGDYIHLDIDTIIIGKLSKLLEINYPLSCTKILGWCHDNNRKIPVQLKSYHERTKQILKEDEHMTEFFNSAIIICKDTPITHDFYRTWHSLWLKSSLEYGYHKDQPDFWRSNYLHNNLIKEIPLRYNLPTTNPKFSLLNLFNGKILHYYNSSQKKDCLNLKEGGLFKYVREHGLTKEVRDYVSKLRWVYFKATVRCAINNINLVH